MKLKHAKLAVYGLMTAGLLFTGALVVFLIVPTFGELRQLGDKIVRAQTDLQAQYDNRKKLLSSAAEAQKISDTMAVLASQFVPPGSELNLITSIEAISLKNGVEEHIRLNDLAMPGVEEVRTGFELSLNGPYHQIMQTIVDLERMPTLVIFQDVAFRPGNSAGPDTPVTVVLHGAVAKPPRGL